MREKFKQMHLPGFETIDLNKAINQIFYGVNDKPIISITIERRASEYIINAQVLPAICDFLGLIPICSTPIVVQKKEIDMSSLPEYIISIKLRKLIYDFVGATGLDKLFSFSRELNALITWDGAIGKFNYGFFIIDIQEDKTYEAIYNETGVLEPKSIGKYSDFDIAKVYCERYVRARIGNQ